MAEWSDEELVRYAQVHSCSDLALFATEHVNRLLALAGEPPLSWTGFVSVREHAMNQLVAMIRARQQMTPEQLHAEANARVDETT